MKKFLSVFFLTWSIWVLLSGLAIVEVVSGMLAAIIIAAILGPIVSFEVGIETIPKGLKFIFLYLPVFIFALIKANLDVARRVLNPALPLNPGFVKVPSKLKGDLARLTLANSITLTPGTLSMDVDEDYVYLHWIDVEGESEEAYQEKVSGSFEKILGGIFK